MYIDRLDEIVDRYNKTYHRTVKMKPIKVQSSTYIEHGFEHNKKDSKFKVGDCVRVSKCQKIFTKGYITNWFEEVFVIKKVKNNVPWTYVFSVFNSEKIVGTFYEK